MSSDSSSSDSDERKKKKKKAKKKTKEAKQFDTKSINNGDIKAISKSPVIDSPSVASAKQIKEEATIEDTRAEQVTSARKSVNARDSECVKSRRDRKDSKDNESLLEEWEVDSVIATQQNEGDTSSQDHTEGLEKMDSSEKDKHRRKRKQSRDNVEKDKDRLSKSDESSKDRSDEELDMKKKRKREKDIRSSTEFLADWEREGELITQQIIQNETKFSKKLEKQKKEKWGETDFDTLNVPSLTQLEKEVCRKQLLADEWEVDSLEAIPDLTASKRKSSLSASKKTEKEVRYDKKTDTYIAIEKETAREKKRQERFCAIRIWEEEQEEGEREEMMLLEQKNKRKRDDWDIEESFLRKNEEMEIHKVDEIIKVETEWNKVDEASKDTSAKEDVNKSVMKLEPVSSKRVKKSRWDMGSQSEEKLETKDIWEEEYADWSHLNKCEQKIEKTEKETPRNTDYSEGSCKSDLTDFYHKKSQSRESLERSWTSEATARPVQTKKAEENVITSKNLITVTMSEELIASTKKEHQTGDQFKNILELDTKLKEKTIELYSPSSPALSQKSQVTLFTRINSKQSFVKLSSLK